MLIDRHPSSATRWWSLIALSALVASCQSAPPARPSTPTPVAASNAGGAAGTPSVGGGAQDTTRGQGPGGAPGADPQPRPYNRVITPNAKSREGMFKTHRIGSRVLFEIPTGVLGKDLLLVTRAARVPVNVGYGGQQVAPTLVVRWERREHRILHEDGTYRWFLCRGVAVRGDLVSKTNI